MDNGTSKMERLNGHRKHLLIGGPLLFLLVAGFMYFTGGRYVSTDDAYVQVARTEISANVPGRVVEILVRDNQEVRKDDILFKLDDRDFVNALNDAKAKLASAKLQIAAMKATYRQRQADIRSATAMLQYEKKEFQRQKILAAPGISSQAQLERAQQALTSAQQTVNGAQQELESIRASLNENPDIDVNEHPIVQQAQALLDQADLNLSYTIIKAPLDGIVSKVEQLQVGDYINAATPVFGLVSNKDIWIEGNFKETDLTYMRPGQKATFTVDAYPGREFQGRVVSLSPGTGSSFSLLPPENATGNWVKVVQRLPVRISVDSVGPETPLRMGLSVIVEVDTHHSRLRGGE